MKLPVARTFMEMNLYQDLNPCECGSARFKSDSATLGSWSDGSLVRTRIGKCLDCHRERRFVYGLPDRPPASGGTSWDGFFGGPEPSELLDAGEWLWVAHAMAKSGRSPVPGAPPDRNNQQTLTICLAALDEVLKFIPGPGQRDEPPSDAFWTRRGLAKRDELPGQFQRGRLGAYRSVIVRLVQESGGGWSDGRPVTGQVR
ncbi:hypothetical protein [Winogradskya humida]|uniref:Cytochrome c domain-containing protein n=1 Tax=Winogradskya humida TaxID=113566 RepID=A0ABQ4A181_9ACTN|nr:hypothetical protein [Actinoplanes humidus]GIE24459.1 hypothetical protein Ahu01nite_075610 [Actinoplanes humidus]